MRCSSSSTNAHRHHYTYNQWLEETTLISAYKSQRTKGHREKEEKAKAELRGEKRKKIEGEEKQKNKERKTRGSLCLTGKTSCLYYHLLRPEQGGTERNQGSRLSFPCFFSKKQRPSSSFIKAREDHERKGITTFSISNTRNGRRRENKETIKKESNIEKKHKGRARTHNTKERTTKGRPGNTNIGGRTEANQEKKSKTRGVDKKQ